MPTHAPEPVASPLAKFNPAWVGATIGAVSAVAILGAGFLTIERHTGEIREIQSWRTAKDVGDAELKKDVAYIKDDARQMKESQLRMEATIGRMSNQQQPQIVYLPMPSGQQGTSQSRTGVGPP